MSKKLEEKFWKRVLDERILFFETGVTTETINNLIRQILYLDFISHDDITIYISSPGGVVYAFFSYHDAIRRVKSKINTVVLSMAMSAGAMMLLCGTGKRMAFKNAIVMLHHPSTSFKGEFSFSPSSASILSEHLNLLDRRLKDMSIEYTKITSDNVNAIFDKDSYFTAQQCLELGIIDEILE